MNIVFPGITQAEFNYSIECLEACKQESAKPYGFHHPYFAPGGGYGKQWWQLDSSLALSGYKWIDKHFAEISLQNFMEVQKEDGRICLWGEDVLPGTVAGGNSPQQTQGVSSLPKLFDVAYHIVQMSEDVPLKEKTYGMLKSYLDWWFSHRYDRATGLITAVFEETFIPYLGRSGEYAPVDTNVEVYVGCHYLSLLAKALGKAPEAAIFDQRKNALKTAINTRLWQDEQGAYYPYSIKDKRPVDCLMASTFYPLRLGIAGNLRRKRLLALLTSDKHFNWETIPLTSVSKLDKNFTTTRGIYQGNASWSGNVWTLINEMVVRGLLDCHENALASELAFKTVRAFNHNCTEFINPFDGHGHGVLQYAWTASQYIELIVETIFGIHYNASKKEVLLVPNLVPSLKRHFLALENVPLTSDACIDVFIDHGRVSYSLSKGDLKVCVVQP